MDFYLPWVEVAGGGGGGIGFRASTTDGDASGANLTLTVPTGAAENDIGVIALFGDNSSDVAWNTPTGFTELFQIRSTFGGNRRIGCFYKILGASESSVTVSWVSGTEQHSAVYAAYSGVDTTTPWDVTFASGSHATHTKDTVTPPNSSITTVTDNAAVLVMDGQTHNEITAAGAPSGYTLAGSVLADMRNVILAHNLDVGTAGAVSPGNWTHSGTPINSDASTAVMALRPA